MIGINSAETRIAAGGASWRPTWRSVPPTACFCRAAASPRSKNGPGTRLETEGTDGAEDGGRPDERTETAAEQFLKGNLAIGRQ